MSRKADRAPVDYQLIHQNMDDKSDYNVFDIVLAVCKEQDGLCMDVPTERYRLARAITVALHEADVQGQ
jgi:hypothetical protein